MPSQPVKKHIAILGGGPSALYMYKHLVTSHRSDLEIDLFERSDKLGAGMPYSAAGACEEHVTNVSGNEIPELVTSMEDWIRTLPAKTLQPFQINPDQFSAFQVVPRLLFGQYLSAQFALLQQQALVHELVTRVHLNCEVIDIRDQPEIPSVSVRTQDGSWHSFDAVIICTGHYWPRKHEGKIPLYFDSPYPPTKLALAMNYAVAIRGSSLTAIDAVRTLARNNGRFFTDSANRLVFEPAETSPSFKMVLHSKEGMLPAIRFHLEEPLIDDDSLLSNREIAENRSQNDGFLSLDFVFTKAFKESFREKDPDFYERIRTMSLEEFVDAMMGMREKHEPFSLFAAEYQQAEQSIRRHQSIYWKEMLAVLSYAMNYPAKYFSAEDMSRLKKVLSPLISIVIAFVPQRSAQELLALYEAGVLSIREVGHDSDVVPHPEKGGATYHFQDEQDQPQAVYFPAFVDCIGQPPLDFEDFPFRSLLTNKTISPARLRYQSDQKGRAALDQDNADVEQLPDGNYYLKVPGMAINDDFQVLDEAGQANPRLYIMAVPHIGGYNPDYSGLDFSETASTRISQRLLDYNNEN